MARTSIGKQKEAPAQGLPTVYRDQWIKRKPITGLGQRIVSATVEEFAAKGVLGARVARSVSRNRSPLSHRARQRRGSAEPTAGYGRS